MREIDDRRELFMAELRRTTPMRLMALLAVLALALGACTAEPPGETEDEGSEPPTTGSQPPTTGGDLGTYTLGIFEDVTTDNQWAFNEVAEGTVWNAYFLTPTAASMYTVAYPGIEFVPDLAAGDLEPAVQEGDSWVGTMTLREGLTWSDGEPLTAEDIAFTWNTVKDTELQGGWLDYTDYAPDNGPITAVEAVDELTVQVTFNAQPGLATFGPGTGITNMPIQPMHFWQPVVEEALAEDDPAATLIAASGADAPAIGATEVEELQEGSHAASTANPEYYDAGAQKESGGVSWTEGPFADNFQFPLYGSQEAAVLALADGEVDYLLNPLGMQRGFQDQVAENPDLTAVVNPTNGYRFLAFNHERAPMSDPAFRNALTALINKEFVTESILQGVAFPLYVILPEGNVAWYNEEEANTLADEFGYRGLEDAERKQIAIDLLTEANYSWETPPEVAEDGTLSQAGVGLIGPDGEPVGQLELITPTASYDPLRAAFASYISGVAQEMGIDLVAIPTDFTKIVSDVFTLDDENLYTSPFDMFILGYSLGNAAFPTFHCSFFCTEPRGDSNNTQYSNDDFDAAADTFDTAQTEEEAFEAMWEMERLIARDKPHVPLFDTGILEFYNNRVTYPFTETLSGLQFLSGMQSTAAAAEQ
jgi:peptide/nickel transport system substrate-binding protein